VGGKGKQRFGCGSSSDDEELELCARSKWFRPDEGEVDEQLDMACAPEKMSSPVRRPESFSLLFALKETKNIFFLVSFAARGMLASLRQR
jgi:hypothetical protein